MFCDEFNLPFSFLKDRFRKILKKNRRYEANNSDRKWNGEL
jgi:hypothetical protein